MTGPVCDSWLDPPTEEDYATEPCPECEGGGTLRFTDGLGPCDYCGGTGLIPESSQRSS